MVKRSLGVFIAVIVISALVFPEWPVQLRLARPAMNYWFIVLVWISIPLSLFWLASSFKRNVIRHFFYFISSMTLFPTIVLAWIVAISAPRLGDEIDKSFELISTANVGRANYKLYRTDCGATCSFGLVLRKEFDLPIGIKVVSNEWAMYPAYRGEVLHMNSGEILVLDNKKVLFRREL